MRELRQALNSSGGISMSIEVIGFVLSTGLTLSGLKTRFR
jgi:hypothetical protein